MIDDRTTAEIKKGCSLWLFSDFFSELSQESSCGSANGSLDVCERLSVVDCEPDPQTGNIAASRSGVALSREHHVCDADRGIIPLFGAERAADCLQFIIGHGFTSVMAAVVPSFGRVRRLHSQGDSLSRVVLHPHFDRGGRARVQSRAAADRRLPAASAAFSSGYGRVVMGGDLARTWKAVAA